MFKWRPRFDLALSKLAAGADAGIAALEVEAGKLGAAVVVVLALSLLAEHERIPLVAGRAFAVGVVPVRDALGVCAARAWVARVRLLLASGDRVWVGHIAGEALADRVASEVHIAASVGTTGAGVARVWRWGSHNNPRAACDRVRSWFKAIVAGAHGVALPVHVALRVPAARSWVAGIGSWDALVVLADVARGAVGVPLALPATPCDRVWLGDVVGEAAADGVAVGGH